MYRSNPKVSVTIPYYRRIENLELVLNALARQSADRDDFEVVIGAMEYNCDYVTLCRAFADKVDIVSVMSADPWQISKARNMSMRQARGDIVVALDADILLPRHFIRDIQAFFEWGQNHCIIGQMVDYENNTRDVNHVNVAPFESYLPRMEELEADGPGKIDMRFQEPHMIPWAYAWTALIALPRHAMQAHNLFFDESYRGYGVEDLEWARRIMNTGMPIRMEESIWGIHLPHVRSLAANHATEAMNYRRFLTARPEKPVELACAFGDYDANRLYPNLKTRVTETLDEGARDLGSVVLDGPDGKVLVCGVSFDESGKPLGLGQISDLAGAKIDQSLELLGLSMPFDDKSLSRVLIMPSIAELGEPFAGQAAKEARRLTDMVDHV